MTASPPRNQPGPDRPRRLLLIATILGVAAVLVAGLAVVARITGPTEVTIRSCRPHGPLIPGQTLDPCGLVVLDAVTARVTRVNPATGAIEPDLAQAIDITGTQEVTIRLATGRQFSDGTPVTAQAVARAWNHLADCRQRYPAAFLLNTVAGFQTGPCTGAEPPSLAGITVVDEHTLTLRTSRPDPDLLARLSHPATAPLPESFYQYRRRSGVRPIGAGPFELVQNHDDEIVLRRSPGYTGPFPARVETVRLPVYIDGQEAYNDIRRGPLDHTGVIPADRLIGGRASSGADGRFTLDSSHSSLLALRVMDARLRDPRQRRALSMAINRDFLADRMFSGTRRPASGWAVGSSPVGDCAQTCVYDPQAARALWDQAGGFTETLTVWGTRADADYPLLDTLCHEWRLTLEVHCEVKLAQDSRHLQELVDRKEANSLTLVRLTDTTTTQSAHLTTFAPLLTWPETDPALAQAIRERDFATAGTQFTRTLPVVPLWVGESPHLTSSRVRNPQLTATGTVDLTTLAVR